MIDVCLFNFPEMQDFHGYRIRTLDPRPYFRPNDASSIWVTAKRKFGIKSKIEMLLTAEGVDHLFRSNDPDYRRFTRDFTAKFASCDLLVLSTYCPIHPDILARDFVKPIKILGFVDDPVSTYTRGIPYLWAFDGAFYISPSYREGREMAHALNDWMCQYTYWWPLVPPQHDGDSNRWPLTIPRGIHNQMGESFFQNRDIAVSYIGGFYPPKAKRLSRLREALGADFQVYGRWPMCGYAGLFTWRKGRPVFPRRVRPLSFEQRTSVYCRTKIGFNVHVSDDAAETGNMRMYEVTAHGAMLLANKAAGDAHKHIYEPGVEAVFYESLSDAEEKIRYYLSHPEERIRIARAGFARVHRSYDGEQNLKRFLDWAMSVPRVSRRVAGREFTVSSEVLQDKCAG